MTSSTIAHIMSKKAISIKRPASTRIAKGVRSGAISVEHAVIVTDSATFPLARKAITFEATPPEQEPISTTPAAISSGKPNATAMDQPSSGMTVNCNTIPINTACGMRSARAKSPRLRVAPMPSMITCISGVISVPS